MKEKKNIMQSEKELQNKVINYLKTLEKNGYKIFGEKRQAGGGTYKLGLPDLYVVINGKHLEIEIKAPNKKIIKKTEQTFGENKFARINIPYLISNNFDDIIKFIEQRGNL